MTQKEIKQMRAKQSKKLEQLMASPKMVENAAKKMYPKNWKVIFSGENHPNNLRK
jgi:hypothetical protein